MAQSLICVFVRKLEVYFKFLATGNVWRHVLVFFKMKKKKSLTHWGRVTHICVDDLTIIGSDNGLSPWRHQALIWINAGLLLIGPLGTNFSEILIEIVTFSFKKMHLKVSSAKRRPFCLGFNVLTVYLSWILECLSHSDQLTLKSSEPKDTQNFCIQKTVSEHRYVLTSYNFLLKYKIISFPWREFQMFSDMFMTFPGKDLMCSLLCKHHIVYAVLCYLCKYDIVYAVLYAFVV